MLIRQGGPDPPTGRAAAPTSTCGGFLPGSDYTLFVFHMPFENSQPLIKAMVENATLTAMKTPVGPKPSGCERPGERISQSQDRQG